MRPDRDRSTRARARSSSSAARGGGIVGWSCLVALLVLLAACSLPADPSTATTDETGGPSPTCPSPVLAEIERTIGSQLDAFADDDVAGALSYASEAFRAQIDIASFERLITDAYPAVADPEGFSIRGCRAQPGSAQVLVDVVGADGGRVSLVYAMVEEAGRWAIDGASEPATDPGMVA